MRLFSWAGFSALVIAATAGFLGGEAVHRHDPVDIRVCDGGELSDAPPAVFRAAPLLPPQPLEETSAPPALLAFSGQSVEPPLAEQPVAGPIRTASFEQPTGPELQPRMPYLSDDPAPALLPPLGDVPVLPSTPDPDNPIFQAVKRFIDNAARPPEQPSEITDKVPLGKPPVSEHPSTAPPR
jgi:hypothetical protein